MKKYIIIFLIGLLPILTIAQQVKPDGSNWKHTGTNEFTKQLTIQGQTLSGTNISDTKDFIADSLQIQGNIVQVKDSIYQKSNSYTTRYDFKNEAIKENLIKAYKGFGSTLKLFPLCPPIFNQTLNLTDGRVNYTLCYTADSLLLTGFKFSLTVAGDYTADNYNGIGIYSFSNGVITKISETADDGALWKTTANTIGTKNLPTPIILVPGYYYISTLYNSSAQITAPQFPTNNIGVLINTGQGWTNNSSIAFGSYLNTQTTFTTPITMQGTINGVSPFILGIIGY